MHHALFCGTLRVVQCASSASMLPFFKDAKTQEGGGGGGQGEAEEEEMQNLNQEK